MRTPDFWHQPRGWRASLLWPLGWVYARLTAARLRRRAKVTTLVPVICVGNINAGGTGKTPTTIALLQRLQARGCSAHVVTRGHGGSLNGPVQVAQAHMADLVGDEPMLLAAFAPTWVAKDRSEGVMAAVQAGAEVILLDDGFQNPDVAKDLSIVVVDAARGFGNGLCIPAGPLREPATTGLARADFLLAIGNEDARKAFTPTLPATCTRVDAELLPLLTGMPWENMPVLAFAGIGHPERFFATLRAMGARVIHSEPLADHQPLTPALMARLEADAKRHGAQLVCTEKDAVRLPDGFRAKVLTVPVRLHVADWGPLDAAFTRLGL